MKPKPIPGPTCPCGRILLRTDISSDTRGRRLCQWCARTRPTPQPSPDAQRMLDLMSPFGPSQYAEMYHAVMVALGRVAPAAPKPTTRRTRAGQAALGL
jgi:hypothetical protein